MDMEIVASLTEMGFPVEACKKAAILTHGRGLESATQWLVEHLDDPDILAPLAPSNASGIPISSWHKLNDLKRVSCS